MKKFLLLILSLVFAVSAFFTGCVTTVTESQSSSGTGTSNSGSGSSASGSSSSGSTEGMEDDAYTVSLVAPSGGSITSLGLDLSVLTVYWVNSTSSYSAKFNSSGFAYCNGLDGEYTVTMTGTLENYFYNPNIYTADGSELGRNVEIQLEKFQDWQSYDGSSKYSYAKAVNAGAYRVEFTSSGQQFFFAFIPNLTTTGYQYVISTCANATENDICPTITGENYQTTATKTLDISASQYSGSYAKNVEIVVEKYTQTSGSGLPSYVYILTITTVDEDYSSPVYLDLYISIEKELTDDDYWESVGGLYSRPDMEDYVTPVYTDAAFTDILSGTYTWISDLYTDFSSISYTSKNTATTSGGVTLTRNRDRTSHGYKFYYDENGYYYFYDGNTKDYYMLFVELDGCHYGDGSLYDFSSNARCGNAVPSPLNYVDIITAYVGTSYYESAAGCDIHPVTDQLIDFLYDYSRQNLFFDGVGSLESGGSSGYDYQADDYTTWLFACGIYM